MPVRKIPKNYLGVTGGFSSCKNGEMNGFESLLEKEYMLLLDFDPEVEGYEEQPVVVPVPGVRNGYTPDVLVRRYPDSTGQPRRRRLVEVKTKADLKKNEKKYAPKFAAAERYVAEQGWEFLIVTEDEIRTPRLANLKFLREYRNLKPAQEDIAELLQLVRKSGDSSTTSTLIATLAATEDDQLYWWPIIWHAVVSGKLGCDLDTPLTNDVMLFLPGDSV